MPNTPTGTVTFLFTDIEGSTQLWERHTAWMGAAHARHEAILREAIAAHGGWAYKQIGDAFQAAFQTAPAALAGRGRRPAGARRRAVGRARPAARAHGPAHRRSRGARATTTSARCSTAPRGC